MAVLIKNFEDDLVARLGAIPEVKEKLLTVLSQDHMMYDPRTMDPPFLGIVYGGLSPKQDGSKTGAANLIRFDLVLVGADRCRLCMGDAEGVGGATKYLLDQMRSTIMYTQAPTPSKRLWQFGGEFATQLQLGKKDEFAYVQRWFTTAIVQKV